MDKATAERRRALFQDASYFCLQRAAEHYGPDPDVIARQTFFYRLQDQYTRAGWAVLDVILEAD